MLSRLRGFLLLVGAASAMSVLRPASGHAQLYGVHSGAVDLAAIDAAGLGDTLPSSVGFFSTGQWVLAGGVGAFGGALRGYVGSEFSRVGIPYALGLGYARTIAARDLVGPLHGAIGSELVAGFRHEPHAPNDAGAVSLTIPVGLSVGDPSSTSLGLYAAPYLESGMMRAWEKVPASCAPFCNYRLGDMGFRSAAGVGIGTRAAAGRWSLELFLRDVRWNARSIRELAEGALGVTYRLGR